MHNFFFFYLFLFDRFMRYDQQTTTTGLLTTWERPPKPCGSIVAVTPLPCTRLQDSMIRVRTQYLQNFNSSAHASIRAEKKFSRSWKSTVFGASAAR